MRQSQCCHDAGPCNQRDRQKATATKRASREVRISLLGMDSSRRAPWHIRFALALIEGSSYSPSVTGWLAILQQIQWMHEIHFVHGYLLPRAVLFYSQGIDFDLSRKAGGTFVRGYNHIDFREFRHDGAKEGPKTTEDHDLHSLREMSKFFFDPGQSNLRDRNLDGLIDFLGENPDLPPRIHDETKRLVAHADNPCRSSL